MQSLDGEYKYNVFQMDPGRVVFVFHFGMNCVPFWFVLFLRNTASLAHPRALASAPLPYIPAPLSHRLPLSHRPIRLRGPSRRRTCRSQSPCPPALLSPEAVQNAASLIDHCLHLWNFCHILQLKAQHVRRSAGTCDPRKFLLDNLPCSLHDRARVSAHLNDGVLTDALNLVADQPLAWVAF